VCLHLLHLPNLLLLAHVVVHKPDPPHLHPPPPCFQLAHPGSPPGNLKRRARQWGERSRGRCGYPRAPEMLGWIVEIIAPTPILLPTRASWFGAGKTQKPAPSVGERCRGLVRQRCWGGKLRSWQTPICTHPNPFSDCCTLVRGPGNLKMPGSSMGARSRDFDRQRCWGG
jgi:hypothetical protein